jgi:hypothetical protein
LPAETSGCSAIPRLVLARIFPFAQGLPGSDQLRFLPNRPIGKPAGPPQPPPPCSPDDEPRDGTQWSNPGPAPVIPRLGISDARPLVDL